LIRILAKWSCLVQIRKISALKRPLGVFASDVLHLSPAASYFPACSKKMIGALVRYDLEHPIAVSCYTQMTSLPGVWLQCHQRPQSRECRTVSGRQVLAHQQTGPPSNKLIIAYAEPAGTIETTDRLSGSADIAPDLPDRNRQPDRA